MTALEEHLRSELHALVDDEPAPDLFPAVAAAGRRKRRLRLTTAAGGTAALVAATVLISAGGVGLGGRAERPVEKPPAPPLVTSYFPAERPPLPPHVTVRPAVGRENHVIPRQDVIASWRALWADPRYRNAKGTPTDTIGVLHTADLVVASTPGYRRPEGLGTVRDRLAWMLVSTDYTYQYRPYLAGCSIRSWWEQHKAECASPPPLQTHTGARFDFIDAVTGAGLVAIGTDNHDPTFATTVAPFTKRVPPPPAGTTTLDGRQPILQANQLIGPAPHGSTPRITAQQALIAYNDYGGAADGGDPPTVKLATFYELLPPKGDPDFQNATWHAHLVWLVTVTGITNGPTGLGAGPRSKPQPPSVNCTGTFPVDANTGKAYLYEIACPNSSKGGVGPIVHR